LKISSGIRSSLVFRFVVIREPPFALVGTAATVAQVRPVSLPLGCCLRRLALVFTQY
jgi:hypothetical protein